MTETQAIKWIKENLGAAIQAAIKDTIYTEDWLGGMAYRETGFKIIKYVGKGFSANQIWPLLKGDYGHRENDPAAMYHGYSAWQIDIGSYPTFIQSGNWTSPTHSAKKAVEVLEEKRKYLIKRFPQLEGEALENAITAAYNCGQGNVAKCLADGKGVDYYTHQGNYSQEVRRFREIYKSL